jgi:RNA recognition motif-containing protein
LKKLFIGSLPWAVDDQKLREFFSQAGNVVSAQVIKDRETGRSRGFGFVEMSTEEEAQNAVKNLNGADMEGRKIVVSLARPSERN